MPYGRDLYRILNQPSGNLFVLLHALEKRTGALPRADVELAGSRFEDFAGGWPLRRHRVDVRIRL